MSSRAVGRVAGAGAGERAGERSAPRSGSGSRDANESGALQRSVCEGASAGTEAVCTGTNALRRLRRRFEGCRRGFGGCGRRVGTAAVPVHGRIGARIRRFRGAGVRRRSSSQGPAQEFVAGAGAGVRPRGSSEELGGAMAAGRRAPVCRVAGRHIEIRGRVAGHGAGGVAAGSGRVTGRGRGAFSDSIPRRAMIFLDHAGKPRWPNGAIVGSANRGVCRAARAVRALSPYGRLPLDRKELPGCNHSNVIQRSGDVRRGDAELIRGGRDARGGPDYGSRPVACGSVGFRKRLSRTEWPARRHTYPQQSSVPVPPMSERGEKTTSAPASAPLGRGAGTGE